MSRLVKIILHRHNVDSNRRSGSAALPVFSIQRHSGPAHVFGVYLLGRSRFVYDPFNPLKCGATLWLEAWDSELRVLNQAQPSDPSEGVARVTGRRREILENRKLDHFRLMAAPLKVTGPGFPEHGLLAYGTRHFGPAFLVHEPTRPLPCGSTVWLETRGQVTTQHRA